MGFKPGQSGNPAGKPKGIINKVHNKLRESITAFLEDEFENVKKDFKDLEPKDRLKFYTDLMQYGIPKLQATSLEIDFDKMSEEQLDEIIERLKNSAS